MAAETFLAAFRRRDHYDTTRADARPWLYGIAIRLIGKHRRAEGRYRRMLQAAPAERLATDFGDRSAAGDIDVQLLPAHLTSAERASLEKDPGLLFIIHPAALPGGSVLYIRRLLGHGGAGQPEQQQIGPPEVLKHDRLPC